jgi:ribonuclease P protein component
VRLAPPDRMRRGYDYVLIGRRTALDLPFERLIEDFSRALGRVHGTARNGGNPGQRDGARPKNTPHRGTR